MTPELTNQNGVCDNCHKKETFIHNRTGEICELCVDHVHVDGYDKMTPEEKKKYVRGLLCSRCNIMLGYAKEDPQILRNAANYLERHKCRPYP